LHAKSVHQDQDQDLIFSPRGASRPGPWYQGLHLCITCTETAKFTTSHQTSVMFADEEPQCLPVGVSSKFHRPVTWTFDSNLHIK